jgi:hypothetical protein
VADFLMKANDLRPSIEATLGLGTPATQADRDDLSTTLADPTTVVSFIMRKSGDPTAKVNAAAVIVDAPARRVRYDWAIGDTDAPASYQAEWEVVGPDGKPRTFPTTSYHTIDILADLDGAGA